MNFLGVSSLLEEMARQLVGDGGSPNVFFVTNREAKVLALVMTTEDEAIEVALSVSGAYQVEDRQSGVLWTDPL